MPNARGKATEADVTREMMSIAKQFALVQSPDDSWKRIETLASIRPQLFQEMMPIDDSRVVGSYTYFRERFAFRMFERTPTSETYFCFQPSMRCASLFDPRILHEGALLFAVDVAMGFHAIREKSGTVVTRSLEMDNSAGPIKLGEMLVFRVQTVPSEHKRDIHVMCDAVEVSSARVVIKSKAIFTAVPLQGQNLTEDVYRSTIDTLVKKTEEFESRTEFGDSMQRERVFHQWPDWPQDFHSILFPNKLRSETREIDWPKRAAEDTSGRTMPFEFIPTAMTCSTQQRLFQCGESLGGLVAFSSESMGPWSVHGGCLLATLGQFAVIAATYVESRNKGDIWDLATIHVKFIKPVPIVTVNIIEIAKCEIDNSNQMRMELTLRDQSEPTKVLCIATISLMIKQPRRLGRL